MNLSRQIISAGAESVGLFAELARITAEQRAELRDVTAQTCQIQGTATKFEAEAQQNALNHEADTRLASAGQYFGDALTTVGGEIGGSLAASKVNSSADANTTNTNLKNAEAWEAKLNAPKGQGAQAMVVANNVAPQEKPLATADQLQLVKNYQIKSAEGKISNPDEVLSNNKLTPETQALNLAMSGNSPELDAFKADVRNQVKQCRKSSESLSSRASNSSTMWKEMSRAAGSTLRASGDLVSQSFQRDQGDDKVASALMSYVANTTDSVKRGLESTAQSRTDELRSFADDQRTMAQSNA